MQRDESTLLELSLSDDQAIRSQVGDLQRQGLGDSQTSCGEKTE
jgi:hypothetical protein